MSDSLSPSNRNRLPEQETPQQEPESAGGMQHGSMGNPEEGLEPTAESFARDAGPITPERVRRDEVTADGATDDQEVGNPPLELSSKEDPWNRQTGETVISKTQTPS